MAFLRHNPVKATFNIDGNIDLAMITFDMSNQRRLGRQALSNGMFQESDIICLQQVPGENTYADLFPQGSFQSNYNQGISLKAKTHLAAEDNNQPIPAAEIRPSICTQILNLQNDQTLLAISWHGRQAFERGTSANEVKKENFRSLLLFARRMYDENTVQHVMIGGNFNIPVGTVKRWLNEEFRVIGNGFKVAAPLPAELIGIRQGKQNIDYFVYSFKGIKKVMLEIIDINEYLKIKVPTKKEELIWEVQHLLKLLKLDQTEPPEKPEEFASKKPNLPIEEKTGPKKAAKNEMNAPTSGHEDATKPEGKAKDDEIEKPTSEPNDDITEHVEEVQTFRKSLAVLTNCLEGEK